ncbi:hypothetical protein BGW41_007638 [Actinomortierella wolfii]|nr:hypothetical protein BGW41_007638 [Actinomortierella wolfii]
MNHQPSPILYQSEIPSPSIFNSSGDSTTTTIGQMQGCTPPPPPSTSANTSLPFQPYGDSPYQVPSMASYSLQDQSPVPHFFSSPNAEVPTSPQNEANSNNGVSIDAGVLLSQSTLYGSPQPPSTAQFTHSQAMSPPLTLQATGISTAAAAAQASCSSHRQYYLHHQQQYNQHHQNTQSYQEPMMRLLSQQQQQQNGHYPSATPLVSANHSAGAFESNKKRGRELTRLEVLDHKLDRIEEAQLQHELALRAQYERFMEEQYQLQNRQQQLHEQQQQLRYRKLPQEHFQQLLQEQQSYTPQFQGILPSFATVGSTLVATASTAAPTVPVMNVIQQQQLLSAPAPTAVTTTIVAQAHHDPKALNTQATNNTRHDFLNSSNEVSSSMDHAGIAPTSIGQSVIGAGSKQEFAPQSQLPPGTTSSLLPSQTQQGSQDLHQVAGAQVYNNQNEPLLQAAVHNEPPIPSILVNAQQPIQQPQIQAHSRAQQPLSQIRAQTQTQQQGEKMYGYQSQQYPVLQPAPRVFIPSFPKWPSASSRYETVMAEAGDTSTSNETTANSGAQHVSKDTNDSASSLPSSTIPEPTSTKSTTSDTAIKTTPVSTASTPQKNQPKKANARRNVSVRAMPHAAQAFGYYPTTGTGKWLQDGYGSQDQILQSQSQQQHPSSAAAQLKSEQLLKDIFLHDIGLYWPGTGAQNLRPDGNSWDPQLVVVSWEQSREQDRLTIIPTHESELLKLPFPNEVDRLINIYYENEHLLPPIIPRVMIEKARKTLNHMYSRLLLNTIFGIAGKFDALRKEREGTLAPGSTSSLAEGYKNDGFTQYFNRAYGLLCLYERTYMVYSVRLVQAKMMLLFSYPIQTMSDIIPSLDRDTLFLGLHADLSKWISRPLLRTYRLWTFWICFLLDSVQNVMKGNLSSIDELFIKTELPVLTDLDHDDYHWTRRFLVNEIKLWRIGRQCYEHFEGSMDALELLCSAIEDERDLNMVDLVSEKNDTSSPLSSQDGQPMGKAADDRMSVTPDASNHSATTASTASGTSTMDEQPGVRSRDTSPFYPKSSTTAENGYTTRRSAAAITADKDRYWRSVLDREANEIRLTMLFQKWRDELPSQLWADLEAEEIVGKKSASSTIPPLSSKAPAASSTSTSSPTPMEETFNQSFMQAMSADNQEQSLSSLTSSLSMTMNTNHEGEMCKAARRSVNGRAIALEVVLSVLKILTWYHYIYAIGPALDDLIQRVAKEDSEQQRQRQERSDKDGPCLSGRGSGDNNDARGSTSGAGSSRRILELYQSRIQQTVQEADRIVELGGILLQHYPERTALCCLGKALDWALRVYHRVGLYGVEPLVSTTPDVTIVRPSDTYTTNVNTTVEMTRLPTPQHQQGMEVDEQRQQGHGIEISAKAEGQPMRPSTRPSTQSSASLMVARRQVLSAELRAHCRAQALRTRPLLKQQLTVGHQYYWSWMLAEHESLVQERVEDQEAMINEIAQVQLKLKELKQQQQQPSQNWFRMDGKTTGGSNVYAVPEVLLEGELIEKEKRKMHNMDTLRKRIDQSRQILQHQQQQRPPSSG